MSLFNFLKKEKVPDELPDLVSDELANEKKNSEPLKQIPQKEILENKTKTEEKRDNTSPVYQESVEPVESVNTQEIPKGIALKKIIMPSDKTIENEGYFGELEDDLNKEINDLNKLESWYKNKFLPRDIVTDMRKHWEGKKSGSVIGILGRNFKDRINEKTSKLQVLEKEWQDIYFDLIEKEEEIREQERELKKMLAEFVELCKRKNKEKTAKKQ
jgi:hypothetical protein